MCRFFCGKEDCKDCFSKSMASQYRSKWWSERNEKKAYQVHKSENIKYEFFCDICKHYFSKTPFNVNRKTVSPPWCPYCSGKKLCDNLECKQCFENSFASHPRMKWWSERNTIDPRQITKQNNDMDKKCEFKCECGHYFSSTLNHITYAKGGSWCPYCAGFKLCENETCNDCFNRSFASHNRSKWWSRRNKSNPRMVAISSNSKWWFDCDVCNHSFNSALFPIIKKEGASWCPYCASKKLCDDDTCNWCFEKSFASHPRVKWWSSQNKVKPRNIMKATHDKYYFDCDACNHTFFTSIGSITNKKNPKWCPHCGNSRLCDDKDCKWCFDHSFASHPRAKWWSPRNAINPRNISRRTGKKYEFKCERGHYFKASPDNVSKQNAPRWCPFCKNKTEHFLMEWISRHFPDVIYQYKPEWCRSYKTNNYLPFDFYIPSFATIIELDGHQHFEQVASWEHPRYIQSKDLYKMKLAYDKGIRVIRVPCEFFESQINTKMTLFTLIRVIETGTNPIHLIEMDCEDNRYNYVESFDFTKKEISSILIDKA